MAAAGGGGGTGTWSTPVVATAIVECLTGGAAAPGNSSLAEAESADACNTGEAM
jgi:cell division GTPase FtsZ